MTLLTTVCEISEIHENLENTGLYSVQNNKDEPGNESEDTRRVG